MLLLLFSLLVNCHRTLVVLPSEKDKSKYSKFINNIKQYSQEISFTTIGSSKFELESFGQRLYETVVIFGKEGVGSESQVEKIKNFLDNGGSAIVFAGKNAKYIQESLYSHFQLTAFDSFEDIKSNRTVFLRNFVAPTSIISKPYKELKPLVYEGGFAIINRPNDFRMPLVTGSMIHRTSDERKVNSGHLTREIIPIHCLQSRQGGRVCFVHSYSFALDSTLGLRVDKDDTGKPIKPVSNGNLEFLDEIFQWVSCYKSYLKFSNVTHYDAKTKITPHQYHIKQNITVDADIVFSSGGKFLPYKEDDVQVEIFMLGTFVRHHMKMVSPGRYTDTFMIPDRPGNYKIKVFTSKFGWYNVREEMKIAVRPLNIREKEKFIPAAKPYNAAMISIMIGAYLSVIHFLYHKPSQK